MRAASDGLDCVSGNCGNKPITSLAPSTTSLASEHVDGGGDELSNAGNSFENDDEIDDAETLDTPYTELEQRIAKGVIPGLKSILNPGPSPGNRTARVLACLSEKVKSALATPKANDAD
eukprot:scaffold79501_cov90-Phaeocystis_antarctica.AAC.1